VAAPMPEPPPVMITPVRGAYGMLPVMRPR
jgi:hypothetical protein